MTTKTITVHTIKCTKISLITLTFNDNNFQYQQVTNIIYIITSNYSLIPPDLSGFRLIFKFVTTLEPKRAFKNINHNMYSIYYQKMQFML